MRIVSATEARTHLYRLLDAAEKGKIFTITRRGRPVARLAPLATPNRAVNEVMPSDRPKLIVKGEDDMRRRATAAVENIRRLRREIGWSATVEEILALRDAGRRRACT